MMNGLDFKVTKRCEKGAVRNFQMSFHRSNLESGKLVRIFSIRPDWTLELVQILCTQSPDTWEEFKELGVTRS